MSTRGCDGEAESQNHARTPAKPGPSKNALQAPLCQVVEADQGAAQVQECLMDVVVALIADGEPTILGKPRQCALYKVADGDGVDQMRVSASS